MNQCPNKSCTESVNLQVQVAYCRSEWLTTWSQVVCPTCGLHGPNGPSQYEAIRLWNMIPEFRGFQQG